jgi:hypothetical protein
MFFIAIMVAAYTGSLFSFITIPRLLPPIDTLQVTFLEFQIFQRMIFNGY